MDRNALADDVPMHARETEWMLGQNMFGLPPSDPRYIENLRRPGYESEDIAREFGDALREGNVPLAVGAGGALAMGAIPGATRGRPSEPRPLLRQGPTLPPSVRAAMHPEADVRLPMPYPQEQMPTHMISEAQRAKAEAAGYDTSRMLYTGGTRKFRGVRMADDERDITQSYPYLTDRPQIADHYAFGEMPDVHPRLMYDNYNSPRYNKWTATEGARDAPQITPLWAKRDKVLVVPYSRNDSYSGLSDAALAVLEDELKHSFGKKSFNVYMEDIADAARSKGYNMVEYRGMSDWGGKQNQYIPLVPNAVRSPNARFDPEHASSGNIMAGLAGPAIMAPAVAAALSELTRNKLDDEAQY